MLLKTVDFLIRTMGDDVIFFTVMLTIALIWLVEAHFLEEQIVALEGCLLFGGPVIFRLTNAEYSISPSMIIIGVSTTALIIGIVFMNFLLSDKVASYLFHIKKASRFTAVWACFGIFASACLSELFWFLKLLLIFEERLGLQ